MKKLTNHQQIVLDRIRHSVAFYGRFKTEEQYVCHATSFNGDFHKLSLEYDEYLINEAKKDWQSRIKDIAMNNACYVEHSVTPATLTVLEEAGYIKRLRPSEKNTDDMVQLI